MMRYVLDTNALIELLRDGRSAVSVRASKHPPDEIAIPMIGLHELYFGALKGDRQSQSVAAIDRLLFPTLAFGVEDARRAAEIRVALQRVGMAIGPYDVLIAGQALSRGLVMVTHNVREFARVPGLMIEDWQATTGG